MDSIHGHLADRRNNQRAGRQDNFTDVAASGSVAQSGMTQVSKAARNISVQDLITVLEREPQMTKSIALYRLYERIRSDPSVCSAVNRSVRVWSGLVLRGFLLRAVTIYMIHEGK